MPDDIFRKGRSREIELCPNTALLLQVESCYLDCPLGLSNAFKVRLATPEPYRALVRRMNGVMDRIEAILDKKSGMSAA